LGEPCRVKHVEAGIVALVEAWWGRKKGQWASREGEYKEFW